MKHMNITGVVLLLAAAGCADVEGLRSSERDVAQAEQGVTYTISCYKAADDADGDGYAKVGAVAVDVQANANERLSCPSGYVRFKDDCNDGNGSVHPRRAEVYANGVDDDCTGGVDNPHFDYSATGYNNKTTSFDVTLGLGTANQSSYAASGNLYADITIVALKKTGTSSTLSKVKASSYSSASHVATFPVTGLSKSTVYRVRAKLYRKSGTTYPSLSDTTEWYYTTTDGTMYNELMRTRLLLRAFKQWDESRLGFVGYRGAASRDGTRYGAAVGELWCSEFYSWVASAEVRDIAGLATVGDLIGYFDRFNAYQSNAAAATAGDYLPLETDGGGDPNHSAMFLAYDVSNTNEPIWTIEGNSSNQVKIKSRSEDITWGFGHLTDDMWVR